MKTLVVLLMIAAVTKAGLVHFSPTLYTAAIPITTQYHAQDGLGQYSYGYSGGPSAKAEYKSLDGVTRGSYSYVDADGKLQTVEYTADSANGFQASATNLPKAPVDDKTPPKQVEDTPEVQMAKADHLAAFREAEIRALEHPSNDDNNGDDSRDGQTSNGSQERNLSSETESPNGSNDGSSEFLNNRNGGNGITRFTSNHLNTDLTGFSGLTGLGTSFNGQLTASTLNGLSGLQLNGGSITPATTTEIRPISLDTLGVPNTSYLRVSTPTHGYSIISPTVLTAVPSIRATSSQTISRTLPISLSSTLLAQGLH